MGLNRSVYLFLCTFMQVYIVWHIFIFHFKIEKSFQSPPLRIFDLNKKQDGLFKVTDNFWNQVLQIKGCFCVVFCYLRC